jgi:hypothetical protein
MTILGHVLAHKHPGVERIRTIDGAIVISDDPDLHGWPPELGDIPTDEDIATWTAEYEVYKSAMDEIERLESEVTQRRLRDAYADSTWMDAQEAKIAVEREKL